LWILVGRKSDDSRRPSDSSESVCRFFAPIVSKLDPGSVIATAVVTNLPPTFIHHGDNDGTVPFSDSVLLEGWLKTASIDNKLIRYEKQGHPSLSDSSSWSAKSQNDSLVSTVKLLQTKSTMTFVWTAIEDNEVKSRFNTP
jgi:acetyl esterase/lipase